jgi:DNA-binding NtrC family response regulator
VDTRVVAATNRELEQEVKTGNFREDLYYRLSVVIIRVAPLRERRSDIPLLAEHFLRAAAMKVGRGRLQLAEETLKLMVAYPWPGNVRELESFVEYAALHARGSEVMPEDLPAKLQTSEVRTASRAPFPALFEDLPSLDEVERRYLQHVLKMVEGNRTRAAEILGVDRRTLYRMLERFHLDSDKN